jgi:uncharacterized membrane protein YphA (DoxX/SURF4 family)
LQRLFPAFPGGSPGMALLLLRAVFGLALLTQGIFYWQRSTLTPEVWLVGLMAVILGSFLLVGFLTPIVCVLVALAAIGIALSLLPNSAPNLFDSRPALIFGFAILAAITILGPGAFSVDAHLFGRREIIIPARTPGSGE